jgi:hypothetical protein
MMELETLPEVNLVLFYTEVNGVSILIGYILDKTKTLYVMVAF